MVNRLANLPVADEDASVENRWSQLRDVVQSTALDVLGSACGQHQDWFGDNNVAINALLAEKNRLQLKSPPCIATATATISDAAIDRLPELETNADLDFLPSRTESIKAVPQLSSRKAPGSDAMPAEIYKQSDPLLMNQLTALFQAMLCQGQVPQDLKNNTIVHHYKWKWNHQLCDNHGGISLLKIARKISARVLASHLNGHLEQELPSESQFRSRRRYGTTDMIFAASQLQAKCPEIRTHLHTNFLDLTKAFDRVNRDGP
ncbi:unnamed protein product [Schistocephalus solidus]|uniref:Reverse transcriptase domain-containing protein n=1 Tax=Schistocephalus solidus TaxID=70667 RepID=A0A3P7BY60_SCHSO|nr:unnamed protein product [Schistocephalus solidus]